MLLRGEVFAVSRHRTVYERAQGSQLGRINDSAITEDVVDQAITLFRANVLFRDFDVRGAGDKLLIYLTLYISACLQRESLHCFSTDLNLVSCVKDSFKVVLVVQV